MGVNDVIIDQIEGMEKFIMTFVGLKLSSILFNISNIYSCYISKCRAFIFGKGMINYVKIPKEIKETMVRNLK